MLKWRSIGTVAMGHAISMAGDTGAAWLGLQLLWLVLVIIGIGLAVFCALNKKTNP